MAASGIFNPAYNASIPGSQPLTVFPKLARGALTDPNVVYYLQTGQVGELANYFQTNGQLERRRSISTRTPTPWAPTC